MESDASGRADFAEYVRPVLQRKWLIIVAVIVATGGVYTFYSHQPKEYTAGTLVFAQDPGDPANGVGAQPSSDRSVQNQAAVLYSQAVASAVKSRIRYPGTSSELLSSVQIKPRAGTDLIEISATAGEPQLVADIANGYAKEFVARSNGAQRTRIQGAAQVARQQLRALPGGADNRAARNELSDRIRALDLALSVPPTSTRQIDPAIPPRRAAAPRPTRNAIFAFVLSLVLAVSFAFGLERFDRRLKRPDEAEEAYGLPLLAVLPHSAAPAPQEQGAAALGADLRESFRALRTSVELSHLDQPARTIVVTSGVRGEGKSTVVRNLALAFAEAGKRVAVVECDLRRPSLAEMFGQDHGAGLTEVLSGEKRLDDTILRARARLPATNSVFGAAGSVAASNGGSGAQADESIGIVTLLLSGATPANPPRVLSSTRALEVLDEIAASHDVTIIDSAPLLSVTDSVPLLRYADSIILVGRLSYTTRDTAKRLTAFLKRVPDTHIVGVVANDLMRLESLGYGYGAEYGYEETPRKAAKKTRTPKASDPA